jgi:redox-sensitive bicupin YhaK (pirin superfamily)
LQIWIIPDQTGLPPSYEQQRYELTPGVWTLLGSPDGDGLVSIHQKVKLYALSALQDSLTKFKPHKKSELWLQFVKGACSIDGKELIAGDALAIRDDKEIQILAKQNAELLLFEVLRQ